MKKNSRLHEQKGQSKLLDLGRLLEAHHVEGTEELVLAEEYVKLIKQKTDYLGVKVPYSVVVPYPKGP